MTPKKPDRVFRIEFDAEVKIGDKVFRAENISADECHWDDDVLVGIISTDDPSIFGYGSTLEAAGSEFTKQLREAFSLVVQSREGVVKYEMLGEGAQEKREAFLALFEEQGR